MAWKIEINQFHPEEIRKEIGREKYTSYRHSTSFNRVICHRKFASVIIRDCLNVSSGKSDAIYLYFSISSPSFLHNI
jgi:hypothetical protein